MAEVKCPYCGGWMAATETPLCTKRYYVCSACRSRSPLYEFIADCEVKVQALNDVVEAYREIQSIVRDIQDRIILGKPLGVEVAKIVISVEDRGADALRRLEESNG